MYHNSNLKIRVIDLTSDNEGICEDCGTTAELRPYGPDFTWICFDCGQKNVEGTQKRMDHVLFGERL